MNTQYVFIFPDGEAGRPDHSYKEGLYRIGEKVIIERDERIWIIIDIQHQLRDREALRYILTNVILEQVES